MASLNNDTGGGYVASDISCVRKLYPKNPADRILHQLFFIIYYLIRYLHLGFFSGNRLVESRDFSAHMLTSTFFLQVELAVITTHFAKVYDLSKDIISPTHYFELLDGTVKDATLAHSSSAGSATLLLLASTGTQHTPA